jgi:CubicO group peptidase (beta-lactamase class C family)
MNINRRAVLGGAVALTGAAASARAATSVSGGGREQKKAIEALRPYVEEHLAAWGLPGMTVCAVDRSGFTGFVRAGLAHIDREERVSADHRFQIGSISKVMAGLAIWSLIDEGKLSPDARVADLLPGIKIRRGEAITLQHLLNHTAGIASGPPLILDGGHWTSAEAGTHWHYSNTGYEMVGLIAAQADGRPYPECVEARVLKPLGMTASAGGMRVADRDHYAQGYEPAFNERSPVRPGPMAETPWVDSDNAAGCIAATAGDMAKFLRFLLALAEGKGGAVFSDETAVRFLANPADAPGWAKGAKYGNGIAHVEIDGRKYLHHTGGMVSFCSALHADPEAGVAAFASANVHYGMGYRPRNVTIYACNLLRAASTGAPLPAPAPAMAPLEKPERYAGVFTAQNGDAFEVIADEGRLRLKHGERASDMQASGENFFATREEAFAVHGLLFEMENDRAVRAWAGEVEYAAKPSAGYRPPTPGDLRALAGRYDNDDKWAGVVYVYARDGKLWLGTDAMTPLKGGEWRVGDERSPERVRFDGVVDGKPRRLLFSGTPFWRRFS